MKIYIRFLKYLLRYPYSLCAGFCFMIIFAISSGFSVGMVYPMMDKIFLMAPADDLTENYDLTYHLTEIRNDLNLIREKKIYNISEIKNIVQSRTIFIFNNSDKILILKIIVILSMVIVSIKAFSGYFLSFFFVKVEQGVVKSLQDDTVNSLLNQSLTYFSEHKIGDFISRIIADINLLKNVAISNVAQFLKNFFLVLVFLTIVIVISFRLSLMIIFLFPPLLFILRTINYKIRKYTTRAQTNIADITGTITETLNNIRIVHGFMKQGHEFDKIEQKTRKYRNANTKLQRIMTLYSPLSEFLGTIIALIILYYGGRLVINMDTDLTPGKFFLFLGAMLSLIHPMNIISRLIGQFQNGIVALERIFHIIDSKPDITDKKNAIEKKGFESEIVFDNVSFSYDKEKMVLSNINLSIKKGESFAIVGKSGCGKSTLVDLLIRFYDVDEGRILIDGIDIREYKLKDLRGLFGIVNQEVLLFNTNIFDNIVYGDEYSKDQIQKAIELSYSGNFINNLKEGVYHEIGERGSNLSGGERQRLAIARALIKKPAIFIFDEATSSLDNESETYIQKAFSYVIKGNTSIIIAHRLSTIKDVDKIIVMDEGTIKAQGTHRDLYDNCQLYRKYYDLQFKLDI